MKTKLNSVFSIALVFTLMGCQQVSNEDVDTPTITVENPKEPASEPMSQKEQMPKQTRENLLKTTPAASPNSSPSRAAA